ncbi:GntR family transcriptional regulator [Nocardioides sp. LHG3406-4]|uniref:GntR family transcriptional regulator n=1 Tax=Nocardioides sp. LHG3406-4 TaxID=2804575 RepID=UPI003CE96210
MSLMNSPSDGELTHIDLRSTAEQIAEQLRSAVLHGRLVADEQLSEAELASRFGVSRGPIREAMQRLMQEGLLTRARNRGVFVVAFDQADIQDIYGARSAIECAAAERLLAGGADRAIQRLSDCYAVMQEAARAGDKTALTNADLEFHSALVEESGSVRLLRIQRTLLVESRICMTQLEGRYTQPMAAVQEHVDIVNAMREGDTDVVKQLILRHMQTAVDLLTDPQADEG